MGRYGGKPNWLRREVLAELRHRKEATRKSSSITQEFKSHTAGVKTTKERRGQQEELLQISSRERKVKKNVSLLLNSAGKMERI